MRRNAKQTISKILMLAMVTSVVGTQVQDTHAAKKVALSAKKVTIAQGSSKKVKIKNVKAKKIKKLTVSTNKKKIATVKKNGKTAFTIKGIKAGSAKVTAKIKIGKKTQKLSVKVTVTPKKEVKPETTASAQPTASASSTPASSATPAGSATPLPSVVPSTTPEATESAAPSNVPLYTAAPNKGESRITGTSTVQNPIVSNISIWGLMDNPYSEVGYDYTQYGPYSGLFTKWFEVKDAFKSVYGLLNPANTIQAVNSKAAGMTAQSEDAVEDEIGTTDKIVKSSVTTGLLDFDTKEESDVEKNVVDFVSRTSTSNETQTLKVVADPIGGTDKAIQVTGRSNNWHGIQLDVTDFVKDQTKDYRISMEVAHKTTGSHAKDKFYMQMAYCDEEGQESDDRPLLVQASASSTQWTTLSANYTSKNTDAASYVLFINWYGNTGNADKTYDDFYIKNVKVMEIKSDKTADTTELLSYDSMYTNTESNYGFSLGGCIGSSSFADVNYKSMIDKHFSSMTIDNDLKMYAMLDETATKANSVANGGDGTPVIRIDGAGEEMVKWAYENGIGVRGHTLVCDTAMASNCKYFFCEDYDPSKPYVKREEMLKRLDSFLTQTIQYFEEKYPGTIYVWDLVNEAIEPSTGEFAKGDTRKIQINDNPFYDTIGSDYVEYSFLYARKAVNELKEMYPDRDVNIKLFYNDFNCYEQSKRNAICELVKSIQKLGQENGLGNLIDGVGMQCYLGTTGQGADKLDAKLLQTSTKKSASSIPNAIFKFNDLGCEVMITELTIRNYDKTKLTEHAEYFKNFMQMIIDINNGKITKVLD